MLFHVTGSTTYLADSLHALPTEAAILPHSLWDVQKRSAKVLFETDLDHPSDIPNCAFLENQSLLSALIPAKTFKAAEVLWQKYDIGLPLETLKPWFAGLVLANALAGNLDFNATLGVDRQLWRATSPSKRGVLEGSEAIVAFDTAPAHEQAAYLAMIACTPNVVTARLNRLLLYWQTNDANGFETELQTAKLSFPIMFAGLVDRRNEAWLPTIVTAIISQTPILILVGALHLVGQMSLPALLELKGYPTEIL